MSKTTSENINLLVNEAGLTITKNITFPLFLWGQAVDCYLCNLVKINEIGSKKNFFKFNTDTNWNLKLTDENNVTFCEVEDVSFGERGIYSWNFNNLSCSSLSLVIPPQNKFIPLIYTFAILIFTTIAWKYLKYIYKNYYPLYLLICQVNTSVAFETENDVGSSSKLIRTADSSQNVRPETNHRIRSLDTFRGIAITLMIFVNYGGGEYWFLKHSPWNGVTGADLVFPWFAWIMGVSIAIKIKSELRDSRIKSSIFYRLSLRSFSLICIGIILSNLRHDDLKTIRIPGVLQRFGISYFIVAFLELIFMKRQPILQNSRYSVIEDLIESWKQWSIVIFLQFVHLIVTFFLPVPNCATGYLGPGGLHEHSSNFNCTGGAAGYLDRLVFTEQHIYRRTTCQNLYKSTLPYDPEGLLGVLTTVLCIYLGVHGGRILLVYKPTMQRIKRWLLWFLFTGVIAGLLCNFSKEEGIIPLNKNLWSLSFVLLCSSFAFLLMSILYFIIDKKNWWKGSPFYQCGMNSILLFVGHEIGSRTFPWQWKAFDPSSHLEYVVMDTWAVLLWILIAVILHERKTFIVV